jgi:SAM-dependent methyltransferase
LPPPPADGNGDAPRHHGGEWWERYFDRDFLAIYRPLLPPDEAAHEVDAAMEALELPPPARVLDLACGWGRHALELAARGYRVTGLDLSDTLLAEARREAATRGLRIDWVRADMRAIPCRGAFDAVLCLFSSLGYGLSDEEDLRVLEGARAALRPGGRLLLETMHRDLLAREFVERDWWEGPDGRPVFVEREFDAVAGVSREALRWGEVEKHHEIRVRSATEWAALLARAGLAAGEWLGGWDLSPFHHTSERLIIIASERIEREGREEREGKNVNS